MSAGLDVFDETVQKTNGWLSEISDELDGADRHEAYLALRGTLHAIRDHLPVDEGAQLAAQLPMLVRGIFYDGWDPSRVPVRERSREAFLLRISADFARAYPTVDPEVAARAAIHTLSRHVSAGEYDEVRRIMPQKIRELWN